MPSSRIFSRRMPLGGRVSRSDFRKCIVSLLRGQPTAGSDRGGEPQGITVLNKGFRDPMFGTAPYLLNLSIGPARGCNFYPLGTQGSQEKS